MWPPGGGRDGIRSAIAAREPRADNIAWDIAGGIARDIARARRRPQCTAPGRVVACWTAIIEAGIGTSGAGVSAVAVDRLIDRLIDAAPAALGDIDGGGP